MLLPLKIYEKKIQLSKIKTTMLPENTVKFSQHNLRKSYEMVYSNCYKMSSREKNLLKDYFSSCTNVVREIELYCNDEIKVKHLTIFIFSTFSNKSLIVTIF